MDIFGPLPKTAQGYKYVLVIMDQFSKFIKLYPMKDQKLDTILGLLEGRFFADIGIPQTILTDNGGQFVTDRWSEFARDKGFEARKTSPYNPQSNPVERVMRELGSVMRTYASERQYTWHRILQRTEEVMNSTVHSSTGYTPHELNNGETIELELNPRLIPLRTEELTWEDKVQDAREKLARAARKRRRQADKHGTVEYRPGQEVWIKLHRRSDANRRLTRKIHLVYEGPYRIQRVIRPNAYLVEDLEGQPLGVFNARQLKPNRKATLDNEEDEGMPVSDGEQLEARDEDGGISDDKGPEQIPSEDENRSTYREDSENDGEPGPRGQRVDESISGEDSGNASEEEPIERDDDADDEEEESEQNDDRRGEQTSDDDESILRPSQQRRRILSDTSENEENDARNRDETPPRRASAETVNIPSEPNDDGAGREDEQPNGSGDETGNEQWREIAERWRAPTDEETEQRTEKDREKIIIDSSSEHDETNKPGRNERQAESEEDQDDQRWRQILERLLATSDEEPRRRTDENEDVVIVSDDSDDSSIRRWPRL
ncbi:serine/threonine-protein kinase PRP4 homolog [Temnothorax curvispinosus]|uniref:Serine/threonine-protein kinase PRP4 homolog n=1 Tax=Temnothorax curvispinosus TaxID=300111 RepID=A0A6J1Q488_9HYME|nr:serine/threonine-protein kinase PRP4 homolog [Temnothorax curvispinosus]